MSITINHQTNELSASNGITKIDGFSSDYTSADMLYLRNITPDSIIPLGHKGFYSRDFTGGEGTATANIKRSIGVLARASPGLLDEPTSATSTTATGSGYTATSSLAVGGTGLMKALFNTVDYAAQYSSSNWIVTIDFATAEPVDSYSITRFINVGYQPKTWTFDGSNDGSTWTVLDSQNSTEDWNQNTRIFPIASASYRYYRWAFTANNGSPGAGYVMYNLQIYSSTPVSGEAIFTSYPRNLGSTFPSSARFKCLVTGVTSAPISGTDMKIELSRDGGTNYAVIPFTAEYVSISNTVTFIIHGKVSLASQLQQLNMVYRITFPGLGTNEPKNIPGLLFLWE